MKTNNKKEIRECNQLFNIINTENNNIEYIELYKEDAKEICRNMNKKHIRYENMRFNEGSNIYKIVRIF